MTIADEFRSRNFSELVVLARRARRGHTMADNSLAQTGIYGQWTGVLCVILCFALGIANMFHLHWVILFSVFCL